MIAPHTFALRTRRAEAAEDVGDEAETEGEVRVLLEVGCFFTVVAADLVGAAAMLAPVLVAVVVDNRRDGSTALLHTPRPSPLPLLLDDGC